MKAAGSHIWPSLKHDPPVCWGTGLLALDLILEDKGMAKPKMWAGGSFGNVIVILRYLGWRVAPVAKIGTDAAGDRIVSDLAAWSVKTGGVIRLDEVNTPVVVERVANARSGSNGHRFEWRCPRCGSWLPRYRPLSEPEMISEMQKLPASPQVVYIDRASKSSVLLAKKAKESGAVVVFEPSKVGAVRLFNECLKLADLLKYSHERMGHFPESPELARIPLTIETLGSGGLRYRVALSNKPMTPWKSVPAFPVRKFRDGAGAGDWCTAGILQIAAAHGRKRFLHAISNGIDDALGFGQALANINCAFVGARGAMYALTRNELIDRAVSVWNGSLPLESVTKSHHPEASEAIRVICPSCE
jgi:fructokinase